MRYGIINYGPFLHQVDLFIGMSVFMGECILIKDRSLFMTGWERSRMTFYRKYFLQPTQHAEKKIAAYSILHENFSMPSLRDATQSPGKSTIFSTLKIAVPPSLPLFAGGVAGWPSQNKH